MEPDDDAAEARALLIARAILDTLSGLAGSTGNLDDDTAIVGVAMADVPVDPNAAVQGGTLLVHYLVHEVVKATGKDAEAVIFEAREFLTAFASAGDD